MFSFLDRCHRVGVSVSHTCLSLGYLAEGKLKYSLYCEHLVSEVRPKYWAVAYFFKTKDIPWRQPLLRGSLGSDSGWPRGMEVLLLTLWSFRLGFGAVDAHCRKENMLLSSKITPVECRCEFRLLWGCHCSLLKTQQNAVSSPSSPPCWTSLLFNFFFFCLLLAQSSLLSPRKVYFALL